MALPVDETQTEAPAAFQWGAGGARMTPEEIAARRKVAAALAAQGADYSPIRSVWQGVARAAQGLNAGLEERRTNDAATTNASENAKMIAALVGGAGGVATSPASPAAAVATGGTVPAAVSAAPNAAVRADAPNTIVTPDGQNTIQVLPGSANDPIQAPGPMEEPTGQDRINMVATALGEQPAGSAAGLGAINTIRNRAIDGGYGGNTPTAVVLAPKQYSANNDPAHRAELLARATANTPEVAKVSDAIDQTYGVGKYVAAGPNDPTEGKTHYYDPGSMVPVNAVPKWAQGKEYQTIGSTRFYDDPDSPAGAPVQVADASGGVPAAVAKVAAAQGADPAALPATAAPTQGYAVPGQGAAPAAVAKVSSAINPAVLAAVTSPYADPTTKQLGMTLLAQQMKPKANAAYKDADGNLMQMGPDGTLHAVIQADKTPTSVSEYKYYKDNLPPGETAMPYQTWSIVKARAAATNVTTTVGGENKGLDEAAKLDAEAVRKGQNEKMPALDDADHNFQMMQDAIDRNGGKLPTGGVLGKMGLDLRRTSSYIRENWGIDLGDDPTTSTSLETFNKGGIKASGDMAKAIGGNRVLKVEFDMAQKANPGLETTDGGNKYLIDLNRNTIAIQKDHLQAQEDYWRGHNHSLDGFQKEWNAEVKANPRPLSTFSIVPPIDVGEGTQMVKLPSTGQGGYSWYQKGPNGNTLVSDPAITSKLEDASKPLVAAAKAAEEKTIGGKTYVKQDGNWFEKH